MTELLFNTVIAAAMQLLPVVTLSAIYCSGIYMYVVTRAQAECLRKGLAICITLTKVCI